MLDMRTLLLVNAVLLAVFYVVYRVLPAAFNVRGIVVESRRANVCAIAGKPEKTSFAPAGSAQNSRNRNDSNGRMDDMHHGAPGKSKRLPESVCPLFIW